MHSVEVIGEGSRTSCEPVVYWYLGEYLFNYSIDLTVVHMDLSDEGVYGWCMRESEYEFIIQIDENLEGDEYMQTLLHECYHVMQHVLEIPRCEICAYFSEKINLDKYNQS